jgi:hypothetical protein
MTERPKRKPGALAVGHQIKELEERLAHLEAMLADVRAEAGRSSGAARARLERVAEAVTVRVAQARDSLGTSLTASRARIEREVGLLTRGLRAGVRAGRAAYRAKPRK